MFQVQVNDKCHYEVMVLRCFDGHGSNPVFPHI